VCVLVCVFERVRSPEGSCVCAHEAGAAVVVLPQSTAAADVVVAAAGAATQPLSSNGVLEVCCGLAEG